VAAGRPLAPEADLSILPYLYVRLPRCLKSPIGGQGLRPEPGEMMVVDSRTAASLLAAACTTTMSLRALSSSAAS